jgi:2-dehydro-3-deoxygalactonokinase
MTRLLAIDWGTSSLRGALLDERGAVLTERAFADGILHVAPGGFESTFDRCFGDVMQPGMLCLVSGMAGSRQGWQEAPYCPCPAHFADLAAHVAWVGDRAGRRIGLVPGLSMERGEAGGGAPDVMRGEETQIFGALRMLGWQDATVVLPGTHSKWAVAAGGRVTGFSTWMTGEVYALLRWQSILARTLPGEEPPLDEAAFRQGVGMAQSGPSVLHTAFSTRTLALFGRMPAQALPSYLSGLVIGEELRSQPLARGSRVVLVATPALAERYTLALAVLGVACSCLGSEATWAGLHALAGLVAGEAPCDGTPTPP